MQELLTSTFSLGHSHFGARVTSAGVMERIRGVADVVSVDLTKLYRSGSQKRLMPLLQAGEASWTDGEVQAAELLVLEEATLTSSMLRRTGKAFDFCPEGMAPALRPRVRPPRAAGGRAVCRRPLEERVYHLLPAFLRNRDYYQDGSLRALTAVLELQLQQIEADIGGLYENWFIETCEEWLVPYFADLVGCRRMGVPEANFPSVRTLVANKLLYRQYKGTPAVLARAARDGTGWDGLARPFFELLATTQSMQHLRLDKGRTVDLRDAAALSAIDSPFDVVAHTAQINGPAGDSPSRCPRQGYNLPHLGLFFWRLHRYPLRRTARRVGPGCYTFHPAGFDQPLFSRRQTLERPIDPTAECNLARPLGRRELAEEIAARRAGRLPMTDDFGRLPAFEIHVPASDAPVLVPWRSIGISDLSDWQRPRAVGPRPPRQPDGAGDGCEAIRVEVDPELGRLAFVGGHPKGEVVVSYSYGFSADMGGGPYGGRSLGTTDEDAWLATAGIQVPLAAAGTAPHFPGLAAALSGWPAGSRCGVVLFLDSRSYHAKGGGWRIRLPQGSQLTLKAVDGQFPCLFGDLEVEVEPPDPAAGAGGCGGDPDGGEGAAEDRGATATRLELNGIQLTGKVRVQGALQAEIRHCTLGRCRAPAGAGVGVEVSTESGTFVDLEIQSCITGALHLPAAACRLEIADSIVDGGDGVAIAADAAGGVGAPASLARSTVFGRVSVQELVDVEDVIFTAPVVAKRTHEGQVRHSYLPAGSSTPPAYRCQPHLALEEAGSGAERRRLRLWLVPSFTSTAFGEPGYAQLGRGVPREIAGGATNGSEMGAFQTLRNRHREGNLASILDEYLPWGLEPRIFYVT